METIKKCVITRYDQTITEPPFLTTPIDSVEVKEPEINSNYGSEFAIRLNAVCRSRGYHFKFYTTSYKEGFDYELVVE